MPKPKPAPSAATTDMPRDPSKAPQLDLAADLLALLRDTTTAAIAWRSSAD
jgi:hypothetical protein